MSRLSPHTPEARPGTPGGPSDSSDSPSDRPAGEADSDSDSQGTGNRPGTDPLAKANTGGDIKPDEIVDEAGAGLSHEAPDPARNGGPSGPERNIGKQRKKLRPGS